MRSPDAEPRDAPLAPARLAAGALQGLFFLAYPFVVYLAFTRLETRGVAGILLGLYGLSVLVRARRPGEVWQIAKPLLGLVPLVALAVATGDRRVLLLLPALASLYVLFVFARSLRRGPPLVERFARAVEDDLPDFCLPYCRKVTWVWCAFLAANAVAVTLLAAFAPLAWWTVYTGFGFYLAMGALLAGETVVRKLWFRYYGDGLLDRVFARLFPPERTRNGRRSLAYVERRRAHAEAGG